MSGIFPIDSRDLYLPLIKHHLLSNTIHLRKRSGMLLLLLSLAMQQSRICSPLTPRSELQTWKVEVSSTFA